jgi:hypothetical protein
MARHTYTHTSSAAGCCLALLLSPAAVIIFEWIAYAGKKRRGSIDRANEFLLVFSLLTVFFKELIIRRGESLSRFN